MKKLLSFLGILPRFGVKAHVGPEKCREFLKKLRFLPEVS
jgi:hypothetical protein